MVRIGPNYHESLKDVSLEYLVTNELSGDPNKNLADVRTNVLFSHIDLEEDETYLQHIIGSWFFAAYTH